MLVAQTSHNFVLLGFDNIAWLQRQCLACFGYSIDVVPTITAQHSVFLSTPLACYIYAEYHCCVCIALPYLAMTALLHVHAGS